MEFKKSATLSVDGADAVSITVSFLENETAPDEFRITIAGSTLNKPAGEAVWYVREQNGAFSLQISSQSVAAGICLAGCFAGVVSGPLADCLKKAKTRKAIRECITKHGFWQAVNNLSCIYGCLHVT